MTTNEHFLSQHLTDRLDRQQILHGSAAGISFVDRRTFEIPVRKEHLAALGLAEGSVLYSVMLIKKNPNGSDRGKKKHGIHEVEPPPFATLVASPVPPPSWSRGLRVCFSTTRFEGGQLRRLTTALRKMDLYVRHVDAVGGLDLDDYQLATAKDEYIDLQQQGACKAPQPSIVLTVEYPIRSFDASGMCHTAHHFVDQWRRTTNDHTTKQSAETLLLERLSAGLHAANLKALRIEWISPLQTLSGLSQRLPHGSRTKEPETVKLRVQKSSFDPNVLCLSLDTWRRQLDPSTRTNIEDNISPGPTNLAAAISVDTEERTLTAMFVPLERYAVVQFEVVHPSGRLQHLWKEWIYQEVERRGGTILQAFSQGRLEERWARELVVCYFEFAKPVDDDSDGRRFKPNLKYIKRITRCMRGLQGMTRPGGVLPAVYHPPELVDPSIARETSASKNAEGLLFPEYQLEKDGRAGSKALRKLRKRLISDREFIARRTMPGDNIHGLQRRRRWDSTLRDVKLWYRWPDRTDLGYQKKFIASKFEFTKPLDLERYNKLYSKHPRATRSRMRLVDRLVERLIGGSHPERSILIRGAHRSGKTSVINMVCEKINDAGKRSTKDDTQAIGIQIDATVTPPHLLVLAIVRELQRFERSKKGEASKRAGAIINGFKDRVRDVLGTDVEMVSMMGIGLSFAKPTPYEKDLDEQNSGGSRAVVERAARRELLTTWESDEGRAAFMRDSIQLLRETLASLPDTKIPLVVAVDEVSATAAWGNKFAYPVWRSLIESSEFQQVRWLLSSTRPLTEATGYSPLGNAVREFSMRPLSEDEAERLIGNFELASEDSVPIVLTYEAKQYLQWVTGRFPYFLQVVCAHVLERTAAYHIPVITQSLIRHIIRTKVLAELGDYFVAQQDNLSQSLIASVSHSLATSVDPLHDDTFKEGDVGAIGRRKLQQSGLGWAEGPCVVVPLFAYWLWLGSSRNAAIAEQEIAIDD